MKILKRYTKKKGKAKKAVAMASICMLDLKKSCTNWLGAGKDSACEGYKG